MSSPSLLPGSWPSVRFGSQEQVAALAQQARQVIGVAQAMFANGRPVDLTGLDRSVGLLCAKTLDLDPQDAGSARAELVGLVATLDALSV